MNFDANSRFPNLHHLFVAYLNQDWSTDGNSLEEIFDNRGELQRMSGGIRNEISDLLSLKLTNQSLDDLLYGKWFAGYEPDEDEGETWGDILHQIYSICYQYTPNPGRDSSLP